MMHLFNYAFNSHLAFLIEDKFFNSSSGSFNTILGTFQSDLVTGDSRSWKGDDDSAEFVTNMSENFATSGDKISVMFRIHSHRLLYNLVKIFDPGFQFMFGSLHSLFGAQNGDDLSVLVFFTGENNSGASFVSNSLNIGTLTTNQKFVMFRFCPNYGRRRI